MVISTLETEPSLSLATPSIVSSETDSLSPSKGDNKLTKGAELELSIVNVIVTGWHSSITLRQKSESEAQIVNVYSDTTLGWPLKSHVHDQSAPPDVGVVPSKLGPLI